MDPEIKVRSDTEPPEIEVTSAAKTPEIEVTSATNFLWMRLTDEQRLRIEASKRNLGNTTSSDSIFRAPPHIRYNQESDFEPKLVSIGPYYHGRENLKRMEVIKLRCMSDLLKMRSVGGSNTNCVPVNQFMRFGRGARRFYKEKFDDSEEEFVRMLVLDSCFIIRIILSLSSKVLGSIAFLGVSIKMVRSDLLLLENQIPLFFINEVYYWIFANENKQIFPDLEDVLKLFIKLDLPWRCNIINSVFTSDHLLDFYWKSSMPIEILNQLNVKEGQRGYVPEHPNWQQFHFSVPKLIANVTELHEIAGIKFESHDFLYVEFWEGIMRIPHLRIDSSQATLFVNLIAFENYLSPSIRAFSTFIKIMDDLIDSEKDVELLQKSGVIYNKLSSHSMAVTFFNDIGNFCLIDNHKFPFSNLYKDVEIYYKSSWHRRWASLKQNYFSSPWTGISVFAGVLLLFLSAVQTYYTVFPRK